MPYVEVVASRHRGEQDEFGYEHRVEDYQLRPHGRRETSPALECFRRGGYFGHRRGILGGLRDIEPGQRIVVIFHFHRSPEFSQEFLRQTSEHHGREMGVFSTCSHIRPNPVGMSVLEVFRIRGANIDVRRLDMMDGTPILDIKPHVEAGGG